MNHFPVFFEVITRLPTYSIVRGIPWYIGSLSIARYAKYVIFYCQNILVKLICGGMTYLANFLAGLEFDNLFSRLAQSMCKNPGTDER